VSLGKCNWEKSCYKKNDFAERHGEKQVWQQEACLMIIFLCSIELDWLIYILLKDQTTHYYLQQVNLWLYQHVLS
jgi:hypothetical protein